MRQASVFAVLSLLLLVNPAIPADDDGKGDVELRKRLLKTWKRQRGEIITAKLVFDHYRWFATPASPARGNEQTLTALLNLKKRDGKGSYEKVRDSFTGGIDFDTVILVDGENARNDDAEESVVLKEGKEYRFDKVVKQLTLLPTKSGVEIFTPSSLRLIPYVTDENDISKIKILPSESGSLRVQYLLWQVDLENSGNVLQATGLVGGKPATTWFHIGESVSHDAFLPRLTVRADYNKDGNIRFLDLFLFKEATINQLIDPSVFTMAAPKGTVVVNKMKGDARPVRLKQDEPNVEQLAAPIPQSESQMTTNWALWATVLALIVVGIGWYFSRRRAN